MGSRATSLDLGAIPTDMAGRFRLALTRRGWSHTELAALAGVRKNTVGDILSGKVDDPHVETVNRLCLALRVNPNFVMLGVLPMFFEDSASNLEPVADEPIAPNTLGVDQWLSTEKGKLTDDERAYMRSLDWERPMARQPDAVYLLKLAEYRARKALPDTRNGKPARR